jgi:hypothetical protein
MGSAYAASDGKCYYQCGSAYAGYQGGAPDAWYEEPDCTECGYVADATTLCS